MVADLFAGTPVSNLPRSVEWYSRLFGTGPAFRPNDDEAVWELADERHLFVEVRPDHAGHARHLLFVDDLPGRVAAAAGHGLLPASDQSLPDGVRKVGYLDPDGNRFEFAGFLPHGPDSS